MSELQPYGSSGQIVPGGTTPSRYSALGREVARVNGSALVRAVQIDTEARLTDAKISAASGLASSAQQHVAQLTAMEAELTKAVPLAGARLEMIGNLATLAMTEMVTDSIATFRRM